MKITIKTRLGEVIGNQNEDLQEFLGIRYAKAPINDLRYRPPVLIQDWQPPFDATTVGPMAPQGNDDNPPILLKESEDCLRLNIWTPNADNTKRPVMVFIHGGAFMIGSASRPRNHGGKLTKRGNVVIINIQYRLGMLGFLNLEGISPNLGIQDQICALKWIKANISDYGGDPENITIFGESAGSLSVLLLMLAPKSLGLFQKAICQSGALDLEYPEKDGEYSRETTLKLLKFLHISPLEIKKLRDTPIEQLRSAMRKLTKKKSLTDRLFFPFPDGNTIPLNVKGAWKTGHSKDIPLIIGTNAEELPFLTSGVLNSKFKQLVAKYLIVNGIRKESGFTKSQIKRLLDVYKEHYKDLNYPKNIEYDALLTDVSFWIRTIKQAELHSTLNDTYVYTLDYKPPNMHATPHVFELLFVFGDITSRDMIEIMQLKGTPAEYHLSEQIMDAWINFAHKGDPNHEELPEWKKYDKESRTTMIFDVPCKSVKKYREKIRIAWEYLNS